MLNNIGYLKIFQNKLDDAVSYLQESLEIRRKLFVSCGVAFWLEYSDTLNKLGYCKTLQNKLDDAEIYLKRALDVQKDIMKIYRDPFIDQFAITQNYLGFLNYLKEDYPESKNNFEESLAIQKKLVDKYPKIYRLDYLDTLKKYAQLLTKLSLSTDIMTINKEIEKYSID